MRSWIELYYGQEWKCPNHLGGFKYILLYNIIMLVSWIENLYLHSYDLISDWRARNSMRTKLYYTFGRASNLVSVYMVYF